MNSQSTTLSAPAIAGGEPLKRTPFGSAPRYGAEELAELQSALAQQTLFYASGRKVRQLEETFASKLGFAHAVATSSGTASIHAALIALGVSPGDEVIVPPITDMGSIAPVLFQGAVPIFADLDPRTYNLTAETIAARLTTKTRAIIAVHLAGNPCDMRTIRDVAERRGVAVVEDCAQAHGTRYMDEPVGKYGALGCYSFNEFKHISCGDGGIVVTDDADLARRLRLATDKGYDRTPNVTVRAPQFLSNNYRMTELQGAVALAQFRKLDNIISRRHRWAEALTRRLTGLPGLLLPPTTPGGMHSYWFYLLRIDSSVLHVDADAFATAMNAEGIPVKAHYIGQPIYEYPVFKKHSAFAHAEHPFSVHNYASGDCPVAEDILKHGVVMPINEAYTADDLDETASAFGRVTEWFSKQGPSDKSF